MTDLLIRNAHLIDPASGLDTQKDLLVRDGRIAAIEHPGSFTALEVQDTIDAAGLVLAPGFIDVHVHLREPGQTWKETIATGTRAAAAGGYTTVVAMPNTVPVNDTVESLTWMLAPERNSAIHLLAMSAATQGSMGEHLTHYEALAIAGAVGFTDDGKPILDDHVMRAALVVAARLGLPISQHAEDTRLTGGCSMNAGPVAFRLGLRGMTVEAESNIVERDIALLREIESDEGLRPHLHVQHVSTAKALSAIRQAKQQGLHVSCEAAPHHFTLTDEALEGYNTNAKMNPPLRAEADRLAVIEAILDGTVDCIATDHAPHAAHEKEVEFERAPNGITGIETALGLALRVLHREHGLPVAHVVALMSNNPAKIVCLKDRGSLAVGNYADIVLFDPAVEWTFAAAQSLSKSKNTPFDQSPMLGRVHATISEGRIVHRH
ncbi:dihydroorotase [Granulicella aggregans]|uniref:Dihydroorotase n=1 Tax=Granulicella aggregans TaxID=474949 RepID=A0A7W7ZF05_9BACT|nr:dihydroorotase [Granulicella aggregans]MBB5058626.1 dihydroorotase [Granulicella aggregans]